MPNPSYRPLFSYPNDIWLELKLMKLRIMKFSPVSCHFPSQVKIFYATPYNQTPSAIFPLWGWNTKFLTSAKYRPNYIAIYFNLYVFGYEYWRQFF